MNNINFAPFPILTTQKLKLRRLKLEDDNEIHFLRSDEAVNKYIDRPKTINKIDAEKFIKKINYGIDKNEWIYWAITRKENDKLIGTICIWNFSEDNLTAELGFELAPQYQGKGIMKEVLDKIIEYGFTNLKMKKLNGYTNLLNIPSIKLMEKAGFVQDNIFEEKHSVSGESLKTVVYSIEG